MRAVVESAGVKDILTKCIGSANPHNAIRATIGALKGLRSVEDRATLRGKQVADIHPVQERKSKVSLVDAK